MAALLVNHLVMELREQVGRTDTGVMRSRIVAIPKRIIALGLATVLLTVGCSRTVTGGSQDSPDSKYRLLVRVYGPYGRSFVDESNKKLRITIVTLGKQEAILFAKDYSVRGSDVCWVSKWDKRDGLNVEVYDFGRGVTSYTAKERDADTNHIWIMSYRLNSNTGKFEEQPGK